MNNINELYHFGVKGMHWGVRRYQNKDGSLTALGKKVKQTRLDFEKQELDRNKRFREDDKKIYDDHKKGMRSVKASDIAFAGQRYLEAHRAECLNKRFIQAIESNELKLGEHYTAKYSNNKLFKNTLIPVTTEAGYKKTQEISNAFNKEYDKKYKKQIDEVKRFKQKSDKELHKILKNIKDPELREIAVMEYYDV